MGALAPEPYLIAVATLLTRWPYVEEAMIEVMSALLGAAPRSYVAMPLWRTIISTEAKIKAMWALLHELPQNDDKPVAYDEILNEYERLSRVRNSYAHGGWSTHSSGKVYLSEATPAVQSIMLTKPRLVSLREVQNNAQATQDLWMRIYGELRPRRGG